MACFLIPVPASMFAFELLKMEAFFQKYGHEVFYLFSDESVCYGGPSFLEKLKPWDRKTPADAFLKLPYVNLDLYHISIPFIDVEIMENLEFTVLNILFKFFHHVHSPKIAISCGGTRVPLDSVRGITNLSTGRLGQSLAKEAYAQGMEVEVLECCVEESLPLEVPFFKVKKTRTFQELYDSYVNISVDDFDSFFHIAAVSDFLCKQSEGKISSENHLILEFEKAPKLISLENIKKIPLHYACKLTATSEEEGISIAQNMMEKYSLQGVLWNHFESFGNLKHHGLLLSKNEERLDISPLWYKDEIAKGFVKLFLKHFQEKRGDF